ncbi:vacuolar cation/proton exchanger 5 [Cucumis sativus]|uniref:Vacuolar cation/proton exchanger n=1 Tax=Cucumis sativus TaxID=3659 RepID=J7KMU1_CUCSA|nr:vacuolar cation/proton exchanger 5 [Cucumis sativus]AFQ99297.1 cation exchanger CAX5 [Cucumis sativus]
MLDSFAYKSMKIVIFTNKLNFLMPFGPIAILVDELAGHNLLITIYALVEVFMWIPVLGLPPESIGYHTVGGALRQLAFYTGPTAGGLLNATFGNATELIISIFALRSQMIRVVQLSLLGSILSNMLLVLGCAFFCGGIVFNKKEQTFNKATAVVNSGLLLMAVMGLLFPALLHYTHSEAHFGKSELALSRFSSCIMLLAYAAYLFFQLMSQMNLYSSVYEEETHSEESSDEDEAPEISKWESVIWLSILTVWISVLSKYLVDAIEIASESLKIPVSFISVILLPIVGNAAEHASAIMFAMKDKLDISLGVAIGSSTQISMFGIPFCVVTGWIMGQPMDLNFQLFETATLFITVIVVAFLLQEGTSNYFKGLMLILCYLIVAASFFVHVDPPLSGEYQL